MHGCGSESWTTTCAFIVQSEFFLPFERKILINNYFSALQLIFQSRYVVYTIYATTNVSVLIYY